MRDRKAIAVHPPSALVRGAKVWEAFEKLLPVRFQPFGAVNSRPLSR